MEILLLWFSENPNNFGNFTELKQKKFCLI